MGSSSAAKFDPDPEATPPDFTVPGDDLGEGVSESAATTELRALLAQGAVPDPPWHIGDDYGQPYIHGKSGPGWYDVVAEEVSNEETAKLIVGAVNALSGLLDEIDQLRRDNMALGKALGKEAT